MIDGLFTGSTSIGNVLASKLLEDARRSRQHARMAQEDLDDVFGNAIVGMVLVDRQRTCTRANRALCALLERSAGEIEGKSLDTLLHPEDARAVTEVVDRLFAGELEEWRSEIRFSQSVPSTSHAELALAVCGREKTRHHLIAQVVDITARKLAEQQRDGFERDLRLSQKLEAVGQLAAGVAHEINTPIQFVRDSVSFVEEGFADILDVLDACVAIQRVAEAGQDIPPELLRAAGDAMEFADLDYLRERIPAALTRSLEGTDRVASIVKALRNFAHPPTTEKAPVDINRVISNTLVVARNEYKYVAEVVTDLGDVPSVMGNAGEFDQILLNLIVNAAHTIEDTVGNSGERGEITIETKSEFGYVTVTVSDTGGGIPAHVADRVFDPFFTTKEIGRGTGQGLAIARSIVDRHGGLISFESQTGVGTTFFIHIPVLASDAQREDTDPVTGLANRGAWERVLIAEEARCERYGRTAAVLVGRVSRDSTDDGHPGQISDRLLVAAADVLRGELRSNDIVARVGDDEFAVLAVGTDQANASALAGRLSASAAKAGVGMTFEVACRTSVGSLPVAYDSATALHGREGERAIAPGQVLG